MIDAASQPAPVGGRIRVVREAQGMSQQDVADQVADHGVRWHQTTVAKVEAGERELRLSEAVAVADVLGVEVAVLVGADHDDTAEAQGRAAELDAMAQWVESRRRRVRGADELGGGA